MGYMTILKKTDKELCLLREPTFLSKAVFVGFLVGISGVLLFGSETLLLKVLIAVVATILSSFMVDNYEMCDMNKESSEIRLTRLHLCQYFLATFLSSYPFVTCKLSDVGDVRVEDHDVGVVVEDSSSGNSKMMYRVVLVLKSGIPLGITEVYTNDDFSEHKEVAGTITSFLGLDKYASKVVETEQYEGADSSSDDDKSLDEEEDDFEEITKAEIEKLQDEQHMHLECGDHKGQIITEESKSKEKCKTGESQRADGDKSMI